VTISYNKEALDQLKARRVQRIEQIQRELDKQRTLRDSFASLGDFNFVEEADAGEDPELAIPAWMELQNFVNMRLHELTRVVDYLEGQIKHHQFLLENNR